MNVQEQAEFYREMAMRGIAMYPDGTATAICKTPTIKDDREFFQEEETLLSFGDEDKAIVFIKGYVDWSYVEPEPEPMEVIPLEPVELRFLAEMMVDFGTGPQMVELGNIVVDGQDDDWHTKAELSGAAMGEAWLIKEYPELDVKKVRRDIKIRPIPIQVG